MRKQAWEIVQQDDGTISVTRGHRPIATGLLTQGAAEDVVHGARRDGERVDLVDADGSRRSMAKRFPDAPRKPRAASPAAVNPERPVWSKYLARYGRGGR